MNRKQLQYILQSAGKVFVHLKNGVIGAARREAGVQKLPQNVLSKCILAIG
ncbi:hypothetical protein D3C72_2428440 [compost metagenome]